VLASPVFPEQTAPLSPTPHRNRHRTSRLPNLAAAAYKSSRGLQRESKILWQSGDARRPRGHLAAACKRPLGGAPPVWSLI